MSKILHIAVLIAFLGGIIAPACGFMWGGQYSVIEICTADGIENRVIANKDNPDMPKDAPHKAASDCQFCFANANLVVDMPVTNTANDVLYQTSKAKITSYEVVLLSRLSHSHSARAPPLFV